MKKLWILICGIIAGMVIVALYNRDSSIKTVDSGRVLVEKLATVDADTLVIFDIDNVLLVHEDPWERGYKKERRQAHTIATLYKPESKIERTLDRSVRDHLWSIYALAQKESLVDPIILDVIHTLQKRLVKVIALTHFIVGPIGKIAAVDDWRVATLKSFNIDFSAAFPKFPKIIFEHCNYEGKFPTFQNGVLFTTLACSKGELLKAFFEKIGWKPRTVIMVDDKRENLESIQAELKKMGIAFAGFEYTGADTLSALFDKEVAEFQMQHLIDNETWLTGDEAQQMLRENYGKTTSI